ncbi:extracellular solute-binding protein [Chloroflexi bacterium TSY]|nr:extracellular solute-binding protein [Chloroflexi bacterium TSY]
MMVTQKGISRRLFLQSSMITGMGLALAACVPASTPAADSGGAASTERIEVDVWTGWTEQAATNIEMILDGYNESQETVTAKHVVVPDSMTQKLLAAISAGNPPGTAVVFGANIAYQLAANDGLLSLDDLGDPDQVATLQDWMDPAIWDLGTYENEFVYASMWNQCMGVFVNVTMAEEAVVDVGNPPQTLEELVAVWDQLTIYDDAGNIEVLGGDFTWPQMIMGRFLGMFVEEDGTTVTANHPNNVAALEWLANHWNQMGVEKMQEYIASLQGAGGRSAGQAPLLAGLRATEVTGPWRFNTINEFASDDFRFTVWPFPSPEGVDTKGMYTYGDGWIVPVGSPDPNAAWEIISTMTGATGNRDVYTSLFTTWLCVNGPVSQSMTEWPSFQSDVMGSCPGYEEIFLDDLFNSDQYLYPPKVPTSSSYLSLMGAEWEKARLGEKSPQEALDFVQEEAQKELDTWLEQSGA